MNKNFTLKLFNFSTPLMNTELYSILGNKYEKSLPFTFEFVDDLQSAHVILWDGVITPKNHKAVERIAGLIGPERILFLIGESMTLFKDHPLVSMIETGSLNVVELPGWSVLPEEILSKIEACYKKLSHV